MAEINHSDSCIFPYEIRGMLDSFAMVFWKFAPGPALLLACHHSQSTPPLGGIWLLHHHGFVVTADRYGDDSVHGGPLTS